MAAVPALLMSACAQVVLLLVHACAQPAAAMFAAGRSRRGIGGPASAPCIEQPPPLPTTAAAATQAGQHLRYLAMDGYAGGNDTWNWTWSAWQPVRAYAGCNVGLQLLPKATSQAWREIGLELTARKTDDALAGAPAPLPHQFVPSSRVFVHGEGDGDYPCIRIPSVVTVGGLLVAFAEGRRWYGDGCCPAAAFPVPGVCINGSSSSSRLPAAATTNSDRCRTDVVMKTSSNGGASWSALAVAAPCCSNQNALVTHAGETLLYCSNISAPTAGAGAGSANLLFRAPKPSSTVTVAALKFGPGTVVRNGTQPLLSPKTGLPVKLGNGPGRAIQLSATHPLAPARILSAGYWELADWQSCGADPCNQSATLVFFSDDNARTHTASTPYLEGIDESQLVELAGGGLLLFSRNRLSCIAPRTGHDMRGLCIAQTRSSDAGSTWFGMRANPSLTHADCQTSVLRHPALSAGVIFAQPEYDLADADYRTISRWNGTVRISTDNATTWPADAALRVTAFPPNPFSHDSGSFRTAHYGYSCLTELPPPKTASGVGVLYETGAPECRYSSHDGFSSACQVRFAVLPLPHATRLAPPVKSDDSRAPSGRGVGPGSSALLFLDARHLSRARAVNFSLGEVHLLSEYRDPSSFVGWGYPNVWQVQPAAGAAGAAAAKWRMMYQGWYLKDGKVDTEIALMAESVDGVSWTPAAMGGLCAQLPHVSNCVMVDGHEEFSVVFDDALHAPPSERLKLLFFGNCSTFVSSDGDRWRPFGRWTASTIDGAWVHRNPLRPAEIVVTGRPQSLRHAEGRHAGYHAALGWAALAHGNISRALPLDELYTPSDQIYGLPSFDYAGTVVTHFWRYRCPDTNSKCFTGGFVSSALAFSHNSRNWTAFGQFDPLACLARGGRAPRPCLDSTGMPPPPPPPARFQLPELFSNRPNTASAGQIYPNSLVDLGPEDGRLLIHASASTHQ
jgi:hypothetical protein